MNIKVGLALDFTFSCPIKDFINQSLITACPRDRELNFLRYLLALANLHVSETVISPYFEEGSDPTDFSRNGSVMGLIRYLETGIVDILAVTGTLTPKRIERLKWIYASLSDGLYAFEIVPSMQQTEDTQKNVITEPFSKMVWTLVGAFGGLCLIINLLLFISRNKPLILIYVLAESVAVAILFAHYNANFRAQSFVKECPVVRFNDFDSLKAAALSGKLTLVAPKYLFSEPSSKVRKNPELVPLMGYMLYTNSTREACSLIAQNQRLVLLGFKEEVQALCLETFPLLRPVELNLRKKQFGFLISPRSPSLANQLSVFSNLLRGYVEHVYAGGKNRGKNPKKLCHFHISRLVSWKNFWTVVRMYLFFVSCGFCLLVLEICGQRYYHHYHYNLS